MIKSCELCNKQFDKRNIARFCSRSCKDKNNKEKLQYRYNDYKYNAKIRNLTFELTLEQLNDLTNNTCSYCDKYSDGKDYVGIDRIINDIGYNLGNCIPCCTWCNAAKSDLTIEEFLNKIKNIKIQCNMV